MSSVPDHDGAVAIKLPLGQTISLSYSSYFRHFPEVLRASWIWLLLSVALSGAASWWQWSTLARTMADLKGGMRPEQLIHQQSMLIGVALFANVVNLVFLVAGVSIAVAWHRYLILAEQPGLSGSNLVSGNFWRYVGAGLAIALMVLVPFLAVAVPAFLWLSSFAGAPPKSGIVIVSLIALIVYIAGVTAFLRLSLLLPGRAAGDLTLTFRHTWKQTRGNTWRIFWGLLACSVPAGLLVQIAFVAAVGFPNPVTLASDATIIRMVITNAVALICYLLTMPIWIGFLSLAYLHFFARAPSDGSAVSTRGN